MRPAIAAIVDSLLQREQRILTLDQIGEAIGAAAISVDEIEEIYRLLEDAGRHIDTATPNVRNHLALVLREARRLKQLQHCSPTIEAIAEATGLDVNGVRTALLYASVLGR
jgi:hypothetical protein